MRLVTEKRLPDFLRDISVNQKYFKVNILFDNSEGMPESSGIPFLGQVIFHTVLFCAILKNSKIIVTVKIQ